MIAGKDALVVAGLALAAAALVGLAGALLLIAVRGRTVRWSLAALAVVPALSALAGVLVVSRAMFLSTHDLAVATTVIGISMLAGVGIALALAQQVARDTVALGESARTMGAPSGFAPPGRPLPQEFARIGADMAAGDAELRAATERAALLEASRRELVAWVSHDLRSPLAGLRAMAEALEDGVVSEPADVRRYLAGIRTEADRLAVMIDDLFELARIHAGSLLLTVGRVGLDELVSEVVATADPVARSKSVTLTAAAAPDVPVTVDVREVGRVLRNLVSNAIHHTPAHGSVQIVGDGDHEHAYVTVTDSCGGIPEADLPRVFDVAFRGSAARTPTADSGAGLGLAIARGIVEAHDGEIAVRNVPGGCSFEVRLPRDPEAVAG